MATSSTSARSVRRSTASGEPTSSTRSAPGIIQATAYFAQAAKEAGVEAIVNMSQIIAREDANSRSARDH